MKDARGSDEQAVPALAAQHSEYIVRQLAAFIEFERDDSTVHRFMAGRKLSQPQTLADVSTYLWALRPAPAPVSRRNHIDANLMAMGKDLYVAGCADCHLPTAEGDGEHFVPALNGQNYSYLLLQFRRIAHGHRFDSPDALVASMDGLTVTEMEALALYLSQLPASRDAAGSRP